MNADEMEQGMQGTYVVTGGGSGTGRAVARRLTKAGCTVVVWGRTTSKLEETVSEGDAAAYFSVDVADPAAIERAFSELSTKFEPINGFVHCAGIWTGGKLIKVEPSTVVSHMNTVALGSLLCIRGAVMALSERHGRIVQIAAASGKAGFDETALNMAAKRAQDGLHEGLARELKGTGIRLTTIYPDNIGRVGSDRVTGGKAMSYDDVADAVMWILNTNETVWVQELLLTAPNSPRGPL
jgi:NADP-dependent 3-hydroxy acid dehydrogenase YdfG